MIPIIIKWNKTTKCKSMKFNRKINFSIFMDLFSFLKVFFSITITKSIQPITQKIKITNVFVTQMKSNTYPIAVAFCMSIFQQTSINKTQYIETVRSNTRICSQPRCKKRIWNKRPVVTEMALLDALPHAISLTLTCQCLKTMSNKLPAFILTINHKRKKEKTNKLFFIVQKNRRRFLNTNGVIQGNIKFTPRQHVPDKCSQNHYKQNYYSNQPYLFTRLCITSIIQSAKQVHINYDKKQACSICMTKF